MSREIKCRIRLRNKVDGKILMMYNSIFDAMNGVAFYEIDRSEWEFLSADEYAGFNSKNDKEIYEGDEVLYNVPCRTTQTHTGDNIPNGSYTEPMEPGIEAKQGIVVFKDGMFQIEQEDNTCPIAYANMEWDLESIKEAISYCRPDSFVFDDPEEGDLQYLIEECAKVKTAEELILFLNGIEIIGNIYETTAPQRTMSKE
jgi:hypothetical protein